MRVTGVIQAGGKSTRMGGRPKALLELGGRRIIERVLDAVRPVVDDVLIVTNTPDLYGFLGVPMVPDAYPEHGSLGGIFTGLAAASGDAVFTVACDMPFLHRDVARLVVDRAGQGDVVIPRVGEQLETLHAVYGKGCLPAIEARLGLACHVPVAPSLEQRAESGRDVDLVVAVLAACLEQRDGHLWILGETCREHAPR